MAKTFLFLLLSFSFTTAHAQSMCMVSPDRYVVLTQSIAPRIRPEILVQGKQIADEMKRVGQAAAALEREVITTTNINIHQSSTKATPLQADVLKLKSNVENFTRSLNNLERTLGQDILATYFEIASRLVKISAATKPQEMSMQKFKSDYGIRMTARTRNLIYPTIKELPQGVEMVTLNTKDLGFRVTISSEVIFQSLVRGAATSRAMGQGPKAYLETVRCTLSRLILAKYQVNRNVLSENLNQLPVGSNEPICLGTKVGEFNDFISRDADELSEFIVREQVGMQFPNILRQLPSAIQSAILMNPAIAEKLLTYYTYPSLVANDAAQIDPKVLANINAGVASQMEVLYRQFPQFAKLRNLWSSNSMRAIASRVLSNLTGCYFETVDENKQPIGLEQMISWLGKTEDLAFTTSLEQEFAKTNIILSKMSADKAQDAIKSIIIDSRVRAAKQAMQDFLFRVATQVSVDRDQLLASLDGEITSRATAELEARWAPSGTDAFVKQVVQNVLSPSSVSKRSELKLYLMAKTMFEKARDIQHIMDHKTNYRDLGYNRPALVRIFSGEMSTISPLNKTRLDFVLGETDPAQKVQMYKNLEDRVRKQANAVGASCGANSSVKNFFIGAAAWFGYSPSAGPRDIAQNDCDVITRMGDILVLNQMNEPRNALNVIRVLSPRISLDELQKFMDTYREEVASDLLAENRLLDMPINPAKRDSTRLYAFLGSQINSTRGRITDALIQQNLPLISVMLRASLPQLASNLTTVVRAKSADDLQFFIKNTNVINRILGQEDNGANNSQYLASFNFALTLPQVNQAGLDSTALITSQGLHFPQLLQYHQQLQAEMIRKQAARFDNWNEFVSFQGNLQMWVLAGWGLKWVFGWLPKWTGGPLLSSVIKGAGSRASWLIGAHGMLFTPLYIGTIGVYQLEKNDFSTNLDSINTLMRSDSLKLGAAATALPLIDWNDYRMQKKSFEENIKMLSSAQKQAATFIAAGLAIGYLPRWGLLKSPVRKTDELLAKSALTKSNSPFEMSLKAQMHSLKNQQGRYMATLGNPASFDITTLKNARDAALAKTGNGIIGKLRERRINSAYENIIGNIGSRVFQYQNYPNLNKIMNRVLFGERASEEALRQWYAEYMRLFGGR